MSCPPKTLPEDNKSTWPCYDDSVDCWAAGVLAHEVLTGRTPFRGQDKAEVSDRVLGGLPALSHSLSPMALDFIRRCLQAEPGKRATCDHLLLHPWIVNNNRSELEGAVPPSKAEGFVVPQRRTLAAALGRPVQQQAGAEAPAGQPSPAVLAALLPEPRAQRRRTDSDLAPLLSAQVLDVSFRSGGGSKRKSEALDLQPAAAAARRSRSAVEGLPPAGAHPSKRQASGARLQGSGPQAPTSSLSLPGLSQLQLFSHHSAPQPTGSSSGRPVESGATADHLVLGGTGGRAEVVLQSAAAATQQSSMLRQLLSLFTGARGNAAPAHGGTAAGPPSGQTEQGPDPRQQP